MFNLVNEAFRFFFWGITSFCLGTMDVIYDVVERIAILDVGEFDWIWTWFTAVCSFLVLFLICRVGFDFFKAMADEDFRDKVDPLRVVKRILVISLIIGLLPIVLPSFSEFAGEMNGKVTEILNGGEEIKPSSVIVAVGYDGEQIDYNTININEKVDKVYKYFPSNFDIMFTLVGSCIACVLYVFIAMQVGQRLFSLMMKILVAPFSTSSLISIEENSFGTWIKLVVSDLITTWFQLALLMLVLTVVVVVDLGDDLVGNVAMVLFFIAGLMTVMNAPSGIAQLLGGDVGAGQSMQQLQNLAAIGHGFNLAGHAMGSAAGTAGNVIGNVANTVGNAGMTAGAAGIYYGGRMAGGISKIGNTIDSASGGSGMSSGTNTTTQSNEMGENVGTGQSMNSYPTGASNVRKDSLAEKTAKKFSNNGLGRMANKAGASLYNSSANRLSRPVTKMTKKGEEITRDSNFVRLHNAKESLKKNVKSSVDAYKGK